MKNAMKKSQSANLRRGGGNRRVDELKARVDELTQTVRQLAMISNIDNTLSNGLAFISDKLQPLQELEKLRELKELQPLRELEKLRELKELKKLGELTPQRTPVELGPAVRLQKLRKALDRPKWTGAGPLPVTEGPVRFIGEDFTPSPPSVLQTPANTSVPFPALEPGSGRTQSWSDES